MPMPAARMLDNHVCPMVDVLVPHVGGPLMGPGAPTIIIGGMPAACMGDMAICVGPPDLVADGSPTVLLEGRPAARMMDECAHGGMIMTGFPTVLL